MSVMKDLYLIVAPNDNDYDDAVTSWTKRGYNVITYNISNLKTIVDELVFLMQRTRKKMRFAFLESAWGNIPSKKLVYLMQRIKVEPNFGWLVLLTKN